MSIIHVLVAVSSPDLKAKGVMAWVQRSTDMTLVTNAPVSLFEIEASLQAIDPRSACILVLVGSRVDAQRLEAKWLRERSRMILLHFEDKDDAAHIALRHPSEDALLDSLRALLARRNVPAAERVVVMRFEEPPADAEFGALPRNRARVPRDPPLPPSPLRVAVAEWVRLLLGNAADAINHSQGGTLGFTIAAEAIVEILKNPQPLSPRREPSEALCDAEDALERAMAQAPLDGSDRLAGLLHRFELGHFEKLVLFLALAPELDIRFQRGIGLLLDDASRRAPTLGLCAALLGDEALSRAKLAVSGGLTRWALLAGHDGQAPQANDPVRLPAPIVDWLFGASAAFTRAPEVMRVLRRQPWPGAKLLAQNDLLAWSAREVRRLIERATGVVRIYDASESRDWRAMLEGGAKASQVRPLRIDGVRLLALEPEQVRATCIHLAWSQALQTRPVLLDTSGWEPTPTSENAMGVALQTFHALGCPIGWVTDDLPHALRLIGSLPFSLTRLPLDTAALRLRAAQSAASILNIPLDEVAARSLVGMVPLHAAEMDNALQLACTRISGHDSEFQRTEHFINACQDVASECSSGLATSLVPAFSLKDVVLPHDCAEQLREIVDNMRLSSQVLDTWKFREQLPYGRGVAALFQGPSGTGKTMSALGIARELGARVLRLDLSRVVSKYIGDTEKNLERVFEDARNSGAVLLIDEADALLGKRSEVKDAHDRYANIEVAYLLQRIELHDGLAIFTTNLRQNLDAAFLRRLRFVVGFPPPDIDAREEIWRRCMTRDSHALSDADFRQLARKLDLSGGHIRQISLRSAFIAAAHGTKIELPHIVRAANAELEKLGHAPVNLLPAASREAA